MNDEVFCGMDDEQTLGAAAEAVESLGPQAPIRFRGLALPPRF